ncbi:hypothetical protein B0G75_102428 [Paraburkholderia sp. BL18I3N2]|uniref:hypothetical protein n=1 Tax=Paraburkholderia sp. BL18I3N2 TaxID=1938799 RepID=UPI000D442DA8|nr:hypothetical protein [Paraburkholderia sp. BL18I3N2]PRX34396.1 hypothetical protein B0G75_102428 [Paraburkholderia sp. BL18I3N2]
MLHRKLVLLKMEQNALDHRELIKDESFVKTLNSADRDIIKRWYFYAKNFGASSAPWDIQYVVKDRNGEAQPYPFCQEIGDESVLVGFSDHALFEPGIVVLESEEGGEVHVPNATNDAEMNLHLRRFEPHDDKHHPNSRGDISIMDLKQELGQRVLDCSIGFAGEKRRMGCYRRSIYEFLPHENGAYHGWKLSVADGNALNDELRKTLFALDAYEGPT